MLTPSLNGKGDDVFLREGGHVRGGKGRVWLPVKFRHDRLLLIPLLPSSSNCALNACAITHYKMSVSAFHVSTHTDCVFGLMGCFEA